MDEATLRRLAEEADERGNYDLSTSYYRQLLKIQPYDYELMKELAVTLFLQSNFSAAAEVYHDAIAKLESQGKTGKRLGNMHISLAEAYLKLNKFEEAQNQLEIASKADATLSSLYDSWGGLYEAKGEYDKALTAYEEYTHVLPDDHDGYLKMARVHQKLKQYDLATELLKIAKMLGPGDYWVEIGLGNLAMAMEDYNTALIHYKAAQELDSRKPAVIFSMGRAYLMMKDYLNARKMFTLALERRPNNADSMHGLAQVEIAEGNTRQAIALLKSAILINPNNHSYYALLIQTQTTSGRMLEALRTSLKARKLFANRKT